MKALLLTILVTLSPPAMAGTWKTSCVTVDGLAIVRTSMHTPTENYSYLEILSGPHKGTYPFDRFIGKPNFASEDTYLFRGQGDDRHDREVEILQRDLEDRKASITLRVHFPSQPDSYRAYGSCDAAVFLP